MNLPQPAGLQPAELQPAELPKISPGRSGRVHLPEGSAQDQFEHACGNAE